MSQSMTNVNELRSLFRQCLFLIMKQVLPEKLQVKLAYDCKSEQGLILVVSYKSQDRVDQAIFHKFEKLVFSLVQRPRISHSSER